MLKIKDKIEKEISKIVDYSLSVKEKVNRQSELRYTLKKTLRKKGPVSPTKKNMSKLLLLELEQENKGDKSKENSALMRSLSATYNSST